MEKIGRKIKELRLRKGWTLKRLGEAIGKTTAYLSIIENKRDTIKRPLLEQIATALGVDISYFAGPEQEPGHKLPILRDLQQLLDRHSGKTSDELREVHTVPLLNEIPAGPPISRTDPYPVGAADDHIEVPTDISDPAAFALRIKGDSMSPRLLDGDIIIICPSWEAKQNRPVIAKLRSDEVTCKIYSRVDGAVILTSLNPEYPPQIYKESDVTWIYPVVKIIANLYY